MPTVVIIDNLVDNRSKLMRLIKSDFKEKTDEMIERSLLILDTDAVSGMENEKDIYEQEKTVFLLLGPRAKDLKSNIPREATVLVCPLFGQEAIEQERDIYYMNYFSRINYVLLQRYGKTMF